MFRDVDSAALLSHSREKSLPALLQRPCTITCKSHVFPEHCGSGNVKVIFMSLLRGSPRHGIFYISFSFPFIFLKQPVSENFHGQIIKRLQLVLATAHPL